MKHGFKKPFVYFLLIMMVLSTENFSFVNAGENSSENKQLKLKHLLRRNKNGKVNC